MKRKKLSKNNPNKGIISFDLENDYESDYPLLFLLKKQKMIYYDLSCQTQMGLLDHVVKKIYDDMSQAVGYMSQHVGHTQQDMKYVFYEGVEYFVSKKHYLGYTFYEIIPLKETEIEELVVFGLFHMQSYQIKGFRYRLSVSMTGLLRSTRVWIFKLLGTVLSNISYTDVVFYRHYYVSLYRTLASYKKQGKSKEQIANDNTLSVSDRSIALISMIAIGSFQPQNNFVMIGNEHALTIEYWNMGGFIRKRVLFSLLKLKLSSSGDCDSQILQTWKFDQYDPDCY